jgi:hypothetical protein
MPASPPPAMSRVMNHVPAALVERANQYPVMVRAVSKTSKTIVFSATNLSKESIRGFTGIARVFDLIGNEIVDIAIDDTTPVPAGKSVILTENIDPTAQNELAKFFVDTPNQNLTYVYLPTRVIDKSGRAHYVRAIAPTAK